MKIRPEWSEKFLKKCAKADKVFGWEKDAAVKEAEEFFLQASIDELKTALSSEAIDFDLDFYNGDDGFVGPYFVRPTFMTVNSEDMVNWKEYLSKVLTLRRLENSNEERT